MTGEIALWLSLTILTKDMTLYETPQVSTHMEILIQAYSIHINNKINLFKNL